MKTHLGMLTLPIEGEGHFAVRSLDALGREAEQAPHAGDGLRIFIGIQSDVLAESTIERLKQCALNIMDGKLDLWVSRQPSHGLDSSTWFACESHRPLEVLARDVAAARAIALGRFGSSTRTDRMDEVIVEVLRQTADPDPKVFLEKLRQRVRRLASTGHGASSPATTTVNAKSAADPNGAAMRLRDNLINRGWPDSKAAGKNLLSTVGGAEAKASRARGANELLGAYAGKKAGYVHPDFQFLASGGLHHRLPELFDAMGNNPGLAARNDVSGWERVFWLYQPRGRLSVQALALRNASPSQVVADPTRFDQLDKSPRAPADVFVEDPQAVIDLAREDAQAQTPPRHHAASGSLAHG